MDLAHEIFQLVTVILFLWISNYTIYTISNSLIQKYNNTIILHFENKFNFKDHTRL